MLLRSGRSVFDSPGRFTGYSGEIGNIVKGGLRNRFAGGLDATFGGYASGHLAPSSFIFPQKAGAISSYTEAYMVLAPLSTTLTPAMPMTAVATLTLTAASFQVDKIVQLIASGSMVLVVNSSLLSSSLSIAASGSLSLTGAGQLGGIFNVTASSTFTLSGSALPSALAFMVVPPEVSGDPLSPQNLATAVWEKAIETGWNAEQILRVLGAVAAGKTDIVDLGGGAASVVFRNIADTKNRITAGMIGSERNTITIDKD